MKQSIVPDARGLVRQWIEPSRPVAGSLAAAVGIGLAAGVAGTAAMTLSSTIESKIRNRGSSSTPARAASKVLGVAPIDDRGERRFNNLVHWGYGTAWGGVGGLVRGLGLSGVPAALAHLAAVWGAEQVVLPATGASEPATKWGAKEIAVDVGHHVVYVAATALAFVWLSGERR